jgi:hypothetical protein
MSGQNVAGGEFVYSLLYISRAELAGSTVEAEIEAIVRVSTARNAAAEVTGALLYTGERFAQLLEGSEDAVREIMARIARDPRHSELTIIEQGPAERRRSARWSMAYGGRSTFAASTVERALADRDAPDGYAMRNLIRLLQELARS